MFDTLTRSRMSRDFILKGYHWVIVNVHGSTQLPQALGGAADVLSPNSGSQLMLLNESQIAISVGFVHSPVVQPSKQYLRKNDAGSESAPATTRKNPVPGPAPKIPEPE